MWKEEGKEPAFGLMNGIGRPIGFQSHFEETLQLVVLGRQSTQQYGIKILFPNITIKETSCDDWLYRAL